MTSLLVIADDDGVVRSNAIQPADVLISCGDVSEKVILDAARIAACGHILAVKGNHDSSADFPPPILDLHLTFKTIDGKRFGGFHGSWRYKPRGNFLYDQAEVKAVLARFPRVDVFVAHNSPRHVHDRDDDVHYGFEAFAEYIERARPSVFLHGHQHVNCETTIGETRVIGVFGVRRIEG